MLREMEKQGPIFDKRQLCKARYRKNLRDAQKLNTVSYTNIHLQKNCNTRLMSRKRSVFYWDWK